LEHFGESSIRRADILALAQRVDAYVDDDIEREWSRSVSPAHVQIDLEDGTTHTLRIDLPLGHPSRPMSTADFDTKAMDCFRVAVRPLRDDAHRQLRELVDRLESLDDVRALARVLEPAS
jgi:2-methylcitrate dehydratase PrpD